ncbi:MAG: hypothetical protein NTZ29_12650 [Verrucomicrobia bacterium]|nr:hypothetical protein [Verrucomicrobiota bacterium]
MGLTIVTLMLVYYRSTSNPTLAAKLNRKTGLNPFKTVNEVWVMPAKVMGKTKDMVDKNSSRTGVLDGVIANPQRTSASADQVGGRTAAATDPTKSTASPPPVNTAVSADEKERLAPSLIDYSPAHAAEQQAEGTDSANLSQKSVARRPSNAHGRHSRSTQTHPTRGSHCDYHSGDHRHHRSQRNVHDMGHKRKNQWNLPGQFGPGNAQ